MKKTFYFLLSFLAILCLTLGLAACVSTKPTVTQIALSGGEREFSVGENFTDEGLTVTATYSDGTAKTLDKTEYTVDDSAINFFKTGNYDVTVTVNGTAVSSTYEVQIIPANALRLLMIGNSFSDDTIQYVYEIADNLGLFPVILGNLYIGGCSIDTHYTNAVNDFANYEYRTYNGTSWQTENNVSISTALNDRSWNYVSLQQASDYSGDTTSLYCLNELMDYVKEIKPKAKLVWNMTWAYQQDSTHPAFPKYNSNQTTMYNAICNLAQTEILPRDFATLIPNGTAIQNARTSYVGDTLTRDGYHLTLDLGRYIAGLTLVGALTGQDISQVTYKPNGVTAELKQIAIESAQNALATPFSVTQSTHKTQPAVDLTGLTKMDYLPVGSAYWWSTDTAYNTYHTNKSNSKQYVATPRFTKTQLPVGSKIIVKSGWQYRPEAWVTDAKQTSRPNNVTTYEVNVTAAWWGNYTYRAFNISKVGTPSLEGQYDSARDAFQIYVPTGTPAPTYTKYDSNDATLLSQQGVNISTMKLVEYVPVNGYYNSENENFTSLKMELISDGDTNTHPKFIASPIFTKTTLPVGSVIIVDSGWKYRPDGYLATGKPSSRPANVTTNVVKIDSAWWGDFTVRAFNISNTAQTAINQTPYEAYAHVRIYVPANNA